MTPIINPWWFYLFDMVEKLGSTSTIIATILGIGGVVYFIIWGVVCEGEKLKYSKLIVTLFIISTIFAIFTPSKETCYQMAAASLVTPDNLTTAGNAATDIIDYIVDSIDEILDEKEE